MDMKNKGIMLVLITAVISGFSIFLNSWAVKGFDSGVFTFSKNVLVAILIFAAILLFGRLGDLRKLSRKQWFQLAFIGLIGGSIPFVLFFTGLQMTTGTTGSFIHKTIFIYVAVFAALFLKERLNKYAMLGAALLLVGTYFMIKPDFTLGIGHLLILIATIFWAAENTYAKRVLARISGTTVALGRMAFGSLFILAFLFATGKADLIVSMGSGQYVWIIVTAVLLLGFVLTFYNGLRYVRVTTATSILSLGAPITMLLTFAFQGKPVALHEGIGLLMSLIGIAVLVFFYEKAPSRNLARTMSHGRA